MMAILAVGTALIMTGVAVAISGLVLEAILFAINRSLTASVEVQVERMGMSKLSLWCLQKIR